MNGKIKISRAAALMALELTQEVQDNAFGRRVGIPYTAEYFDSVDGGTPTALALGLVCQALVDADIELPTFYWPDKVDDIVAQAGFSRGVGQNIRKALDSLGYAIVSKEEKS